MSAALALHVRRPSGGHCSHAYKFPDCQGAPEKLPAIGSLYFPWTWMCSLER